MKIPRQTIAWLLETGTPAVRYHTRLLQGTKRPDRAELLSDPFVNEKIKLLKKGWDKEILERHNRPDLLIHRLALLADLGVKADDPGLPGVIGAVLKRANENGIPEVTLRIPKGFGGSGRSERAWLACDFPVILYGLVSLGVRDKRVERGLEALAALVEDNGLRCRGSLAKFRGPGRKEDPCPIACLYAAKALSVRKETASLDAARRAVEALLGHWENRKTKKYYLFGIGADFRKLKFPFVWYNLLHVLDTVSRYDSFRRDRRVKEMADILMAKADGDLRFKPESVYLAYKGHDFADKKNPSPTLTVMALRVLRRLNRLA